MAFKILSDFRSEETNRALLNNSITVKIGDIIAPLGSTSTNIVTNATATVAGATFYALGYVVGFSKTNGEVIGTGTDPSNTPPYITTAADNTTVAKYYAVYIPIRKIDKFEADLDATAGTTTSSDKANVFFTLADCRTLDESTVVVHNDATAPLQFYSTGLKDGSTTKVIGYFSRCMIEK